MAIILDGTNGISDVDGSASTPAIRGTDANTGIFFPAADTTAISTGGSERVRVDSSGNVGIGTSSPTQRLHISGSSSITRLRIESTGSVASSINFTTTSDANGFINYDTGEFKFFNNSGGSATERMRITSGGDLQFNSGYGSVATAYGCRAWVNFNGTGTVAIRASGNVTSITDNGTGEYTVNLTNAMPDANYSVVTTAVAVSSINFQSPLVAAPTSSTFAIYTSSGTTVTDTGTVCAAVFR